MTAGRWQPHEDDALREHVAKGLSISQAAKAMGRSSDSVFRHSRLLGLTWNRDAPLTAARAKLADERSRRARFRVELMGDLERLKAQMFARTTVYNFGGKDNTFEEHTLDQPAIADQLRLVQALTTGLTALEKLQAMDADSGVADAAGLLDKIADAIKSAAKDMDDLL